MREQKWPDTLWLIRHAESSGNLARGAAESDGAPVITIAHRDMDVPLSKLGERQARALGRWIGGRPDRPTAMLTSPYVRASDTARLAAAAAGLDVPVVVDERLREREFGILDRLTKKGIAQRYPEQAALRAHLGKFYHRPPGGESWADVTLRLRSVLDTLVRDYAGERVVVVTHQVVVLLFRYLLERMTEQDVLAVDREHEIANRSVTAYEFDPLLGRQGKLALRLFNHVAPLAEQAEPITSAPDVGVAES